jgi:hypothetical protein
MVWLLLFDAGEAALSQPMQSVSNTAGNDWADKRQVMGASLSSVQKTLGIMRSPSDAVTLLKHQRRL